MSHPNLSVEWSTPPSAEAFASRAVSVDFILLEALRSMAHTLAQSGVVCDVAAQSEVAELTRRIRNQAHDFSRDPDNASAKTLYNAAQLLETELAGVKRAPQ